MKIIIQDFCFSSDQKIYIFAENTIYHWDYINDKNEISLKSFD